MKKPKKPRQKKVSLKSADIAEEKRQRLKQLFPEVFNGDKVNFDALKRVLGEWVEPGKERFGLSWHGKADCMKVIQEASVATLKPDRKESLDFNNTENLFIEGDNLEVLKLLQKSYFEKVKMIYIDPPYNTGQEFIYPDKYSETLDTYLEYTGQKDSEGHTFSTNTEATGRYHSKWLNMMYPRLYLACNLLREDGAIFISIDDNEQANLRSLCDQIFGEENYAGHITWESKTKSQNTKDARNKLQPKTETIFAYFKRQKIGFNLRKTGTKVYAENDERGEFRYAPVEIMSSKGTRGRESMVFPILGVKPPKGHQWQLGKDTINAYQERGDLDIFEDRPRIKMRPNDEEQNITKPFWGFFSKEMGTAESAKKELTNLVPGHGFETVKPTTLVKELLFHAVSKEGIVVDFFAGSCTTAHAVMQLNKEDGGNRKFICVQLPEPTDESSEAFNAGYKTIADIGKERIRRVAKKIKKELENELIQNGTNNLDLGFKVFKLAQSNLKVWDGDVKSSDLEKQLSEHVDHINNAGTPEDILYELLLKAGFLLTTKVQKIEMANKDVFSIENNKMLICLDKNLNQEVIDAMVEASPQRVICLDEGFKGNDQLKTNAVQTFKVRSEQDKSEIPFKTV
jgi:adenine-specific DNA-methyltransferase